MREKNHLRKNQFGLYEIISERSGAIDCSVEGPVVRLVTNRMHNDVDPRTMRHPDSEAKKVNSTG